VSAFAQLQKHDLSSPWAKDLAPFSALREECVELSRDAEFIAELRVYLTNYPVVSRSIEMFYTHISMAARARWDQVPEHMKPIAARGWFIGRWIPTFLIINGPIGRFIFHESSPLASKNRIDYPMLGCARDFMKNELFRSLRNGLAYWSFDWEIENHNSYIIAYDRDRVIRFHQAEADAFHIIAFSIIEVLDDAFSLSTKSQVSFN